MRSYLMEAVPRDSSRAYNSFDALVDTLHEMKRTIALSIGSIGWLGWG